MHLNSLSNRILSFLWIILTLSKLALSMPAFSQESQLEDFKKLDDLITKHLEDNLIPGLAYCVVEDGQMIWSGAAGWANMEINIPMSIDGIMNIASISKTFTATAVMQLWEKGKIKLDEDINVYLPSPIRNPRHPEIPITIFQLLTHTSSIKDGDNYDASYSDGDPVISLKDWIQNYLIPGGNFYDAGSNFHPWAPGGERAYSNVGFGLLGYIVEQVSGIPFNTYCKSHILDPLGMHSSGWFLHEIDSSAHIRPYSFQTRTGSNEEGDSLSDNRALSLYSFPNYPDGLLRTSVRELSHFLMAIINGGAYQNARILKKSTLKKMLKVQVEGSGQGLCWGQLKFESLWGHSGGDPGVATYMYFSPRTKVGVIVFQNNHNSDLFDIFRKLYRTAVE